MRKTWKDAEELADAMKARAEAGKNVVLSPPTALWLARQLHNSIAQHRAPKMKSKFDVDLHGEGSTIYRLDSAGEIDRIDAWARSTAVGRAALESLKEKYPADSFMQKRGSWVEGECGPDVKAKEGQ